MFSSPRLLAPRPRTPLVVFSLGFIAILLGLASVAQAQQQPSIQGIQSSVEKTPSAKQELPAEVRAARGEAPLSRLYDYVQVEQSKIRRLPALDPRRIEEAKPDKKLRIGVVRTFSRPIKVSSDSTLYNVAEGDVRVMGIVSEGALYTRVHFTSMSLPAGARVFVYSLKNPEEFYGPFEGRGPSGDGTFWTPPVEGDAVAIEYFTPNDVADSVDAPFQVSEISHIYRSLFQQAGPENVVGACNVEVSSDWSEVAKSVGYLEFASGDGEFTCTGTLLNNESNDQTPYFLTANHCFSTQTEAQTLRVYWNYNSGNAPSANTLHTDGASLLATGTSSDFTFVRLIGSLPGGLFFAGWDANPTPLSTSVTGIHHPEGSHKRMSSGTTNSSCSGGLPGPCSNFTHVRWNNGTTEAGSSGSGIWKGSPANAQLVGTLTGGFASCSNLSGIDEYGSFSATYPNISSFLAGGQTDLSITKNTAYDQVAPGSKVVYFITVANTKGASAGNISVTDNLPAEVSFVSCNATGGVCGGTGNNRTITFPTLAVGASATITLVATVNNSVANNTVISNTATVSASTPDSNQSNNTATTTVVVNSTPLKPKANGKIVFGSDRAAASPSQPTGTYTINSDGTGESILLTTDPFASAPAWSPDGTRIAYGKRNASGTYGDEIYVTNANGTGSVKVAGNVYDRNSRIAWSPSGAKLAFIGTGSVIYLVNADGTGLSKLPNSPVSINDLSWSPDGSMFAYSNGGDIFVMSVDGSGQTNLTQGRPKNNAEPAGSVLPRWSPDGTRLLFGTESINYRYVYVMNADGTGLSQLIGLHQSMQPAWSPDGTKVTFIALNSLYVSNSDGTGQTQITNNIFYNFKPDWQPLAGATPTMQLSAGNYNVGEAAGHVTITVNRSSSIGAATLNYATSDTAGLTNCNVTNGIASSRCDYATSIGTLRFAIGETSKTISIPIVDDNIAEDNETFAITLSNPTGASMGSTSTATITITDNTNTAGNPIDSVPFFVRQHYIDFLGREPDSFGNRGWQDILNNCASGDTKCDRIEVSAGFFRSSEFQERGYFTYRFYSVALGRKPNYSEFMPDLAKVSGFLTDAEKEANKVAFVDEFMQRPEFKNKYDSTLNNPTAYVDALLSTAGLSNHPSRAGWIAGLTNGSLTRAQVLRQMAESSEAYERFYTEAFVVMQYFGYLRRDPDKFYLDWIAIMNQDKGNYRNMVSGFMNSTEYKARFAP